MSTINGSISRNSSKKMWFYLNVTVTDEPSNYRYKVKVDAIMEIGSWGWSSGSEADSITINIGGTNYKTSWSGKSCSSHYTKYTLGTATRYFSYSFSSQSVSISATSTDIYSAGYGPGVCKASGSVSLAARYSTAGTLSATIGGEDSATMKMTGLPTTAYPRSLVWKYKLSSASSYATLATVSIGANASPGSPARTITGMIPGMTYNFQAVVQTSKGGTITTKTVSATTNAAAGSIALSNITASGMSVTVSGMKSTATYARYVKIYYKKNTSTSWTLASTKTIAANTAAGSPSYTFGGLIPGTTYNVMAQFLIGSTVYKTTNTATCTLPFDGVSVPEVISVSQTAPSAQIVIDWHLKKVELDSLSSTTFKVYIKRSSGSAILVDSVTGSQLDEHYAATSTYDAGSWLLDTESITVYVTATNAYAAGPAVSDEVKANVLRYFYWDSDKSKGAAFGITAQEWNRLKRYVAVAAELHPEYFEPIAYDDVSIGDVFTAALANAAAFASTITVNTFDEIKAADAMSIQTSLQKRMREATGL